MVAAIDTQIPQKSFGMMPDFLESSFLLSIVLES